MADAYSATAPAWGRGPSRIYDRLAVLLLGRSPVPLAGVRVLDVGAGTGAASRAALAAGAAQAVALDRAFGMAGMAAHHAGSPAVVGDAVALPFAGATFGAAVAAFALNHLTNPAAGLREMARVTRPGGAILAATYAADDGHPVKEAVQDALAAHGWTEEPWFTAMGADAVPLLATIERCAEAAAAAGVVAHVEPVRVPFPELSAVDLVAWRLGMAQHAPFVASLSSTDRGGLVADALARLGDAPPLVRSVIVLAAVRA